MSWLLRIWRRMTSANRRPPDADLEDELRLHLKLETERHLASGLSAREASRRPESVSGMVH